MLTKAIRFIYPRRSLLKRLIPLRRPLLLRLDDFKLYVRLDDWAVGARIAVKRSYEAHVTQVMRAALKPSMVVVDIGANIGYYTLLAASQVGEAGKVIAFEPGAQSCELIAKSLTANRLGNAIVHACAVAEQGAIVGFDMDDSNGRISRGDPHKSNYQVRAVRLDDFLQDEGRIDIIKVDVEGAEGRVLKGMLSLLRRHRPLLFTEFNPARLEPVSGVTPREYLEMLWGADYALYVIDRNQGLDASPQSYNQIMSRCEHNPSDHLDLLASPGQEALAAFAAP